MESFLFLVSLLIHLAGKDSGIMKKILFVGIMLSLMVATGCKEDDPSSPDTAVVEAIITHWGFDFSAGAPDTVDFTRNDGETIGWQPGGATNPGYPSYGSYIWFRTSNNSMVNETKDMGIVDLASVTAVPEAWDVSPLIPPLLVDHVIVAACMDGYVKFKVLSTDSTGFWPARVQYVFSATTSFPD